MASFASLSAELLYLCIRYLDIRALKSLRLVSHAAAVFATEKLFETVTLCFSIESVENFDNVLKSQNFRQLVKAVIIDGSDGDKENEHDDDYNRVDTPWSLAIPKISQFPALNEVEFRFDDECGDDEDLFGRDHKQDIKYRRFYQDLLTKVLEAAPSVNSLTIRNIQDALISCTPSRTAQERLRKLALVIVTEETAAPETDIDLAALDYCFNSNLRTHWLEPTQNQLTHLTLNCDVCWGVRPFADLRGLYFPQLQSLALGNWTIIHSWQIEWITSHGATLRELVLDDCPIAYILSVDFELDDQFPGIKGDVRKEVDLRWSDVFPIFQQRLKRLRHFGMGRNRNFDHRYQLPARIEYSRYITFQCGTGPSPWMYEVYTEGEDKDKIEWENDEGELQEVMVPGDEQNAKDEEALRRFLEAIGSMKID
ncbi:hypothetical protein F5Y19DRAFT_450267 [Xylariaceae sp. FL1651]|nr:hypothetical protein F5Y19DRAFT_450267 [Xylariaceae sp. FL1651]